MIHRIPANNLSSLWKREAGRDFGEGRFKTQNCYNIHNMVNDALLNESGASGENRGCSFLLKLWRKWMTMADFLEGGSKSFLFRDLPENVLIGELSKPQRSIERMVSSLGNPDGPGKTSEKSNWIQRHSGWGAACTLEIGGRRAEDRRLRLWLSGAEEHRSQNGRVPGASRFEQEIYEEKYPVEKAGGSAKSDQRT